MHYVFYDTGNDVFFSRITDTFCSAVVRYIADRYNEFLQPGGGMVDHNRIRIFGEENKKVMNPLNCALSGDCGNQQCRNNYKAVLASDQVERFQLSMKHTIQALYKDKDVGCLQKPRGRLNLQVIFQSYVSASRQTVEEIVVSDNKDPIEYKHANLKRHKRLYAAKARKLKKKVDMDADAFVYVRAPTGSDFDYFARKTGLPNLSPCDFFQK